MAHHDERESEEDGVAGLGVPHPLIEVSQPLGRAFHRKVEIGVEERQGPPPQQGFGHPHPQQFVHPAVTLERAQPVVSTIRTDRGSIHRS